MNYRMLLSVGLLSGMCGLQGFGPQTFYLPRSQAVNAVRELVGWQTSIHQAGMDYWYGSVSGTVEYGRSFREEKLAALLFGGNQVTFSGSLVPNRGANDILADYFGLPFCFESTVCFKPRISNVVFDLDWYQGFDSCLPGLYLIAHLPMVHSKADLHMEETVITGVGDACANSAFYPAGYMASVSVPRAQMNTNVQQAFIGHTMVGELEPLQFGRIFGREVRSRIAELQLTLGYTFLLSDWYHLGLGLRVALPTGNRPDMVFLLDATVGNGHHWELGGQLTSHVNVWESENLRHTLGLYLDANITHLFADTQNRSYDLSAGTGSRYMLLQEVAPQSTDLLLSSTGPEAPYQFIGHILPAINVTTLPSSISMAVQADIVCKLAYQRDDGFEFDVGYNFYARSKEQLGCRQKVPENRFVAKGDAQVYGFNTAQEPIRLDVSQSEATVYKAQGAGNFVPGLSFSNVNADTPVPAFDGAGVVINQLNTTDATNLGIAQAQINTSSPIVFIKDTDINECSGLVARAISQSLFVHANKSWWIEGEGFTPFLGGGISTELGGSCLRDNSALSQWRIWLKGGLTY
jgi:hypothetical protein